MVSLEKKCVPLSRRVWYNIGAVYNTADNFVIDASTRVDAAVTRMFRKSCTNGSATKIITGRSGNERRACGLSQGCETYSLAFLVTKGCPYLESEYRNVKKGIRRRRTWLCDY